MNDELLTESLQALRSEARHRRSSAASRDALMKRFEAQKKVRTMSAGTWYLAAAAAILLAVLAAPGFRHALNSNTPAVAEAPNASSQYTETAELRSDPPVDPEAEGFIAVPYVPPLATGEMLRLVHTELNPAALASLGVNVDPAWTSQLPADLLLGEDGMPRAVRVADSASESGGF